MYHKRNNNLVDIVDRDTGTITTAQELGLGNFRNGLDTIPSASIYKTKVVGTDVTRIEVKRLNKKK